MHTTTNTDITTGTGARMDPHTVARTLNTVISEGLNWLGAERGCPALYWALEPGRGALADGAVNALVGHAYGYADRSIGLVLERWARRWSLVATPEDLALREFGITQFTGTLPYRPLGTIQLVIWGVTDRPAFDRFLNTRTTRHRVRTAPVT